MTVESSDKPKKSEKKKRSREKTSAYWRQSLPMRVYMRTVYTLAAAMWCAALLQALPVPVQAVACIVAALIALLFRVILPNGFDDTINSWKESAQQAGAELADGNYDGVPPWLQKTVDYPTPDEAADAKEDLDAQIEELRALGSGILARKKDRER